MQLRAAGSIMSPASKLLRRLPTGRRALSGVNNSVGEGFKLPFKSLMAANRGEIAVRIMRAGNELGLRTCGIFSKEDRFTQHRRADQAFLVGQGKSPVG
ncbi:unnamed protein product, partial [Discosporangium mesarthrocarpum]